MRILSWNVRGLGKKEKKGKFKQLVIQRKIDILLIQETKQRTVSRNFISSIWGGSDFKFVEVEVEGSAGGLLIIWNTDAFTSEEFCCNRNFLLVKGTIKPNFNCINCQCLGPM